MNSDKCEACGKAVAIGEWPYCPHGQAMPSKGFEPFWDEHVADTPVLITNPGDYRKYLKPHWKNDNLEHVQRRDKPASYFRELNDRRAYRAEMERKQR